MFICIYALDIILYSCFLIQTYRYTWFTVVPLISFMLLVIAGTCMPGPHHLIMYTVTSWARQLALSYVLARLISDNPGSSCPDPGVWTVAALLYLIRVAQRKRGLVVACPDPLSSSLLMIGSRDSHLTTREYFPVFHIVHPAFALHCDLIFLRYYIITVYLCYYCWNVYYHCASALWFLPVLMLSVYIWGYFRSAYLRRSNVSVPVGSGRYTVFH